MRVMEACKAFNVECYDMENY